MSEPVFPPMMSGMAVTGPTDPFETACNKAVMGCDSGLVVYNLAADQVGAALVLAPDVVLARAVEMLPLAAVGLQNALGALAPPEVAVHLEWTGGFRVNGARCGGFRIAASTVSPDAIPDWIVVGFALPLLSLSEGGENPDQTALYEEGCVEVTGERLIESWARHTLNWLARWEDDGSAPLHAEWRGLAHDMGEEVNILGQSGTFLGLDENLGLLLRRGEDTDLLPLTLLLEK